MISAADLALVWRMVEGDEFSHVYTNVVFFRFKFPNTQPTSCHQPPKEWLFTFRTVVGIMQLNMALLFVVRICLVCLIPQQFSALKDREERMVGTASELCAFFVKM